MQMLVDKRWLLGGFKTQPGINALWHGIMTMTNAKQEILLKRVFHLHEIARKRGGKGTVPRLSAEAWQQEIDRCCLYGHIIELMKLVPDQFEDTMDKVILGMVEGCLGISFGYHIFSLTDCFLNKTIIDFLYYADSITHRHSTSPLFQPAVTHNSGTSTMMSTMLWPSKTHILTTKKCTCGLSTARKCRLMLPKMH